VEKKSIVDVVCAKVEFFFFFLSDGTYGERDCQRECMERIVGGNILMKKTKKRKKMGVPYCVAFVFSIHLIQKKKKKKKKKEKEEWRKIKKIKIKIEKIENWY
jgi:hypothetical protein